MPSVSLWKRKNIFFCFFCFSLNLRCYHFSLRNLFIKQKQKSLREISLSSLSKPNLHLQFDNRVWVGVVAFDFLFFYRFVFNNNYFIYLFITFWLFGLTLHVGWFFPLVVYKNIY